MKSKSVEILPGPFCREQKTNTDGRFAGLFRACGIPESELEKLKSIAFIPAKKKRKTKAA